MRRDSRSLVGGLTHLAIAPCLAGALTGFGCAGGLDAEVSRLRGELHAVNERLERSETRLQSVEDRLALVSARTLDARNAPSEARASARTEGGGLEAPGFVADPAAPAAALTAGRALPVVRLGVGPGGPVQIDRDAGLEAEGIAGADAPIGAIDRGEPPVLIRIQGDQSERLQVDHDVLERPDPVLDAPRKPEAAYRAALETLRRDRDPARALARFRAFLADHPEHPLADNALYWTGESHQMLVEHAEAIRTFELLLVRYPGSKKAPWAKLRVAESHIALGHVDLGRRLLEALADDEPGTEPARLAGARLERLAVDRN